MLRIFYKRYQMDMCIWDITNIRKQT
jgi:hypothetical protein